MSTEVAERGPIDLEAVPDTVKQMLQRMRLASVLGAAGAQLEIMAQISEAESEEAIFAAADAGTVNGHDWAGRPFLLHSHEWRRAAPGYIAQGAFPFYALCKVTDPMSGENAVLVCGGFSFVSVVDSLDIHGHLARHPEGYPLILESRSTSGGFDVLIPHKYIPPAPVG